MFVCACGLWNTFISFGWHGFINFTPLRSFGLVDDGGKAITFSEWATLAQDRAGWLKLVTKAPFSIGKPQLRPPRCDTRVTPEEKRSFLARRAQETEQRRALFSAETDAETT